ncbi:MAG: histidinol-phosphate transaminase [Paracoccaceae bacterium]
MIRPVPSVAGMAAYALSDPVGPGSVSLAQNESAFPVSPLALAAGRTALEKATLYPDPDWCDLREAIAEVHGIDAAHILCGAGSMELIGSLIRAFAGPGDEVLGSRYGYLFVATACQQSGASHVQAPESDFTLSVEAILVAVTARTRIVFVCNPGNPTGTRIPNQEILRLREALSPDVLLVVDQAYGEFDGQDPAAILALAGRGDTVVLRTFSKAYGLAGARVGWGLFHEAIGKETRKLMNPNNVSGASQAMAAAAMRDQPHMREVVARTAAVRSTFAATLREAGYRIPDSHTNFVLIPFADADVARAADARLRDAGYLLRGMGGYGLSHCLRATIASAEVMGRAADILVAFREERDDR